jgi:hypothetical protein
MNSSLLVVTLLTVSLARANAQVDGLPQCDAAALLEPKNVIFMGEAKSTQVGMYTYY